MKKDMATVIMNSVRQRIIQYLILHEKGTAGEIHEELHDIPIASLYRHIKILLEAGFLEVLEEKQIRGTIERTYSLVKQPMGETPSQEEIAFLVQSSLMSLMTSFQQYFDRGEVNLEKDMLCLTTSTLLLSEEEFMEMLKRIGSVINDYIRNVPEEGRQPRRFTIISSPCEE